MNTDTLNNTFDPQTLADDLMEVRRVYAQFFAGLKEEDWDKPVKGGPKEWTLHETVAHQCALNGAGLESIKSTLQEESYTFIGLENRYKLNAYNRKGIDDLLSIPMKPLGDRLLGILSEAAEIARHLSPDQAEMTGRMPIYNRPVKNIEALGIICFHSGLVHSAQVAEPAGVQPLWVQLSPEVRHRIIGRVMRAFSLLYRIDIGGSLRTSIVFRVGGAGGGEWHVNLSPESPNSGEGAVEHPGLVINMRKTDVFCKMLTLRLNLPLALISRDIRLHGNLRLFLRMGDLFSTDARPKRAGKNPIFNERQTGTAN